MNFLPELWNYIKKASLAVAFIATIIAGGWVAYIYDVSKKPQIVDKQLIVEGDNALNIGRYADAKRIFEAEFKANPQNKQAAWSLEIAQIRQTLSQPGFKEAIDALYQQNPNDAYVNLFLGEFYAANHQPEKAVQYFNQAIEQNPKLAEAHYDLAMLYNQQGNHEDAKVESLKAIEISPIPKYRNNLGAFYFKHQYYEEAIKEYGKNKEYPLSALESAKIYWRLEYLSQALSYQKQAVEWLEDKTIMTRPDNEEAWYFENAPGKKDRAGELDEKKSYAYFCLSVTLYLQGDMEGAENEVQNLRALKVARQADINALLIADLDALVQSNGGFAEQIAPIKSFICNLLKNDAMTPIFYRPAKLRALAFLGLLLLALAILGGMIWRNLHHFETVLSYVNYSHRIQNVSVGLQQSLIGYVTETVPDSHPVVLTKTLSEMKALMADNRYLSSSTRKSLETVSSLLADVSKLDKTEKNARLIQALEVMSQTLDEEGLRREQLLEDINLDTQTELYIALVTFTLILLGAMLFLHYRILHPLNDLRQLLERLTEENYTPITTDHLDPLLFPVFNSYNALVIHLAELEEAKRLYAQSLQREVRLATQALLEQQYSLARAERLAAIGEVAAEFAHEIRNPLAGIQMAFSNLRREIDDQHQCERMDLISSELKRLARLLNDMLDQSRHSPETATDFDMATLIRDLLALTRYQIAESIELA